VASKQQSDVPQGQRLRGIPFFEQGFAPRREFRAKPLKSEKFHMSVM
jgi:hypothetical protein